MVRSARRPSSSCPLCILTVSGPPLPLGQGTAQALGMLQGPTRLSGRTSAKPRPAPAHQLPLGSLIEVAGPFPGRSLQTFGLVVRGREGEWGLGGRPASGLSAAAEPWPPDALPLSRSIRYPRPHHYYGLLEPALRPQLPHQSHRLLGNRPACS